MIRGLKIQTKTGGVNRKYLSSVAQKFDKNLPLNESC